MNRKSFLKLGLAGVISAIAPKAWALKYYPNPSDKEMGCIVRNMVRHFPGCGRVDIGRHGRNCGCIRCAGKSGFKGI